MCERKIITHFNNNHKIQYNGACSLSLNSFRQIFVTMLMQTLHKYGSNQTFATYDYRF